MNFNILLQAQGGDGGFPMQLILLIGIGVVFYFFMIRPQQKRQKEQRKFIEGIKKGDDVVTIGGIHGKVYSVEGETVVIDVDKGTKLTMNKSALSVESTKPKDKK